MCVCKDLAAVHRLPLWHISAVPLYSSPLGLKWDYYQGASPLSSLPGLVSPLEANRCPPSQDPHHEELAVSQVLLILIGSGMTYCQGEWDCHGPTGTGAGGVQEACLHVFSKQM